MTDTFPQERVPVMSRKDFLDEFGRDYHGGQHVSFFGPTGRGKSRLCYQCLQRVGSPELQVVSLHGKIRGRDPVIAQAAKHCNLRIVPELPSGARRRFDRTQRKFHGYMLIPLSRPGESVAEENAMLKREFGRAIHGNYTTTRRQTITHVNEAHQVQEELRLRTECEGPLMRGAPDNAMWSEAQRGRFLSAHTYSAPEHIFIFHDPVLENRKRYSEFGCEIDPGHLEYLTSSLKKKRVADGRTISQCLYIRRSGGMYVIDT
jgi:hypothetical protein